MLGVGSEEIDTDKGGVATDYTKLSENVLSMGSHKPLSRERAPFFGKSRRTR